MSITEPERLHWCDTCGGYFPAGHWRDGDVDKPDQESQEGKG